MTAAHARHTERARRVVRRCGELALITDVQGETTRTYLSDGMRRANALVSGWMTEAGLTVSMDAAGNLRGRRGDGSVILGSHLDTVVNAGAYDGPLGVLLGIEAAALLPDWYGLEVIGFAEEEGVRFRTPFLGSRAVMGTLDDAALALEDAEGVSVREAIGAYGLDATKLEAARLGAGVTAYFEVHLEQGPVLEREGRALAAVAAIAGQTRLRVSFRGQSNHAGTTPMAGRRDALAAAAEWVSDVERQARKTAGLVATVGSLEALPGLGNVIPGFARASLDVRHPDDASRSSAVADLTRAAHNAGERRDVTVEIETVLDQAAVNLDATLRDRLCAAAEACGYDASPLVSGAGHDAMILAPVIPSAMLFVRTPGGLSHHPDEAVSVSDVEAALAVTMEFLGHLASQAAANE